MKRLVMLFILAAAAAGGWYWYRSTRPVEAAEVVRAAVSRGDITESVQATGTIEAIRVYPVGSQVSGRVKAVYVDFNDIVRQGQLIAEIEADQFEVQVKIQQANIDQRKADIENQKVQLADARLKLARAEELAAKGLTPQEQLEAARLAVINREASIANAEKQLVSAEANLDQARLNLSYTRVYSPSDGVIVNRQVDIGQFVQSSTTAPTFFSIATDLRDLRLTGGVDEAQIGKIRPGQAVEFRVDTYPNELFTGTVESVRLNASVQNNVVTYPVRINVKNPDLKLKPSLTATLDIIISRVQDVVRVPNTALRFRPNNDIYVALGLTPPAPGQGRGGGRAGAPANGNGDPQAPAGAAGREGGRGANAQTAPAPTREGGTPPAPGGATSPAERSNGRSGRGFGDGATLTPEQARQFAERFGQGQGRNGGRTGRRGGAGGRGANVRPANDSEQIELGGGRIDDYFPVLPPTRTRATVYTWNAETKDLRMINITVGVTDGQMSELISGELEVGQELVTGVILPASQTSTTRTNTQGNPFQPMGGRGMPGGGGGPGGGGRGGR
jgi:HlyD family secretion protein